MHIIRAMGHSLIANEERNPKFYVSKRTLDDASESECLRVQLSVRHVIALTRSLLRLLLSFVAADETMMELL